MPHRRSSSNVIARFEELRPFCSTGEVDAYLNNEKIQCLLCGKHFGGLNNHLSLKHGIPARAYKEKLNLPFCRGLVGTRVHEIRSAGAIRCGAGMSKIELRAVYDSGGAATADRRGKFFSMQMKERSTGKILSPSQIMKFLAPIRAKGARTLISVIGGCRHGDSISAAARRVGVSPGNAWSLFQRHRYLFWAFKELTVTHNAE